MRDRAVPPPPEPAETVGILARLTGLPIVEVEPMPIGISNRTDVARLDDGRLVVVQRLGDAAIARHRIEVLRVLGPRLRAAGVPVPGLLAADPAARPPFVVTAHVPGRPGNEALDDPRRASALGAEMGRLQRSIASVGTEGLRLPRTWARPDDLARVAGHWLERASHLLPRSAQRRLARSIAVLPDDLAGRPVVLAHGDWAPVNVLVEREVVVGAVDWEFARLADPLFDAAWWGALVRTFHPETWPHVWPAFAEAAGIGQDEATLRRLGVLASLRMLEVLASARVLRDGDGAHAWSIRLLELVDPPA